LQVGTAKQGIYEEAGVGVAGDGVDGEVAPVQVCFQGWAFLQGEVGGGVFKDDAGDLSAGIEEDKSGVAEIGNLAGGLHCICRQDKI
jgi:hypothetical protein